MRTAEFSRKWRGSDVLFSCGRINSYVRDILEPKCLVHTTNYVYLVDILHGMSRVDGGLVNDRRRCSANKDT